MLFGRKGWGGRGARPSDYVVRLRPFSSFSTEKRSVEEECGWCKEENIVLTSSVDGFALPFLSVLFSSPFSHRLPAFLSCGQLRLFPSWLNPVHHEECFRRGLVRLPGTPSSTVLFHRPIASSFSYLIASQPSRPSSSALYAKSLGGWRFFISCSSSSSFNIFLSGNKHHATTSPCLLQSSCQWELKPLQHSEYPLPPNAT